MGTITTLQRDPNGNVSTRTTPDNRTTTYTLDPLNRTTGQQYIDGTRVTRTFDPVGQPQSMGDVTGTTTYTWSPAGVTSRNFERLQLFLAFGEALVIKAPLIPLRPLRRRSRRAERLIETLRPLETGSDWWEPLTLERRERLPRQRDVTPAVTRRHVRWLLQSDLVGGRQPPIAPRLLLTGGTAASLFFPI